MKKISKTALALLFTGLFAGNAMADSASVKELVGKKFPQFTDVQVSKVVGAENLYRVLSGQSIGFTNEKVDFFFVGGNVIMKNNTGKIVALNPVDVPVEDKQVPLDTSANQNTVVNKLNAETDKVVTSVEAPKVPEKKESTPVVSPTTKAETSKSEFGESKIFSKLPFDKAVKIVYGKGERTIAMFADPDCPYCQQMEKEWSELGDKLNMTVYLFYYPLNIHPFAKEKAEFLWCQKDQAAAWTDWMKYANANPAENEIDEQKRWEDWKKKDNRSLNATCDKSVVSETQALARQLGFNMTPTIMFKNSIKNSGVISEATLNKAFDFVEKNPLLPQIENMGSLNETK